MRRGISLRSGAAPSTKNAVVTSAAAWPPPGTDWPGSSTLRPLSGKKRHVAMSTETDRAAHSSRAEGEHARDQESYLTIEEFAARSRMSVSTIRRRIDDGAIPVIQFGGKHTRFSIPESALKAMPRSGSAFPGQPDHQSVQLPRLADDHPTGPGAAGPPIVRPVVGDPSQAHASSSQPPTRLPGRLPKWKLALRKQQAADAPGVRP
jgi:excisionase family DNA binding protein